MNSITWLDNDLFTWGMMPLLIFTARVLDVTLGTMRIIFLSRSKRFIAPFFGFFEVLIWLLAMRQVMQNLNNPASYLAYAAGFATGNIVGIYLEDKLAIGILMVRVVTVRDAGDLIAYLREAGYGVTSLDAQGATGRAHLIYTVIQRKSLPEVQEIIARFNPRAFVSVEEIRSAREGVFPPDHWSKRNFMEIFNLRQKRK